MNIKLAPISSGIIYGEFKDQSGLLCSIEESTHTKANCIWLGCQSMIGGDPSMRMLLTQEMAAALVPLLQLFVEHGCLREDTWTDEAKDIPQEVFEVLAARLPDKGRAIILSTESGTRIESARIMRALTDEELEILKTPLIKPEDLT